MAVRHSLGDGACIDNEQEDECGEPWSAQQTSAMTAVRR